MPFLTYLPLSQYWNMPARLAQRAAEDSSLMSEINKSWSEWSVCSPRPLERKTYQDLEEENRELKYEISTLNYYLRYVSATSLEMIEKNEREISALTADLERAKRQVENLADMNVQAEKDRRRLELGMSVNQGKLDRIRAAIDELDRIRPRPKGAGMILYVIQALLD